MDIYDPRPLVTAYINAGADNMLAVIMASTYNPLTDTLKLSDKERNPKNCFDYAGISFMLLLIGDMGEARANIEIAACVGPNELSIERTQFLIKHWDKVCDVIKKSRAFIDNWRLEHGHKPLDELLR